jgi:hypothetical protein
MVPIPVYLKTDPAMPRPTDPEFFWVTRSGTYLCRNHPFFVSDTLATRRPNALADHRAFCRVNYPKLGVSALEYIVGFFDRVFDLHRSEAIVLLFWDLVNKRYRICGPDQKAKVWESQDGIRTPLDVTYGVPGPLPRNHLLVGDIHSHGNHSAYSSYTDRSDEIYRDGIHVVVGDITMEPPDFHLEMAIDGYRFEMEFGQFFCGYARRRRVVPETWLKHLEVKVTRPQKVKWTPARDSFRNRGGNYWAGENWETDWRGA